jgi:hypothetical protein
MKDLYLNLNINGPVDNANLLTEAIDRCPDADTARAARHILLNPRRKQTYDYNHRVLSTIGQLRAKLALPGSCQWNALGNQDFEYETSSTYTEPLDLVDELDLLNDPSLDAPAHRLPTTTYSRPAVPIRIVFGGVIVMACVCLLLAILSIRGPSSVPLPEHGTVVRYDNTKATSRTSKIKFEARYDAGHYYIKLVSAKDRTTVLTVVVREGQSTTVEVAPGDYELRCSVGREKNWDGERFDPPLREIEHREFSVPPGTRIPLP